MENMYEKFYEKKEEVEGYQHSCPVMNQMCPMMKMMNPMMMYGYGMMNPMMQGGMYPHANPAQYYGNEMYGIKMKTVEMSEVMD